MTIRIISTDGKSEWNAIKRISSRFDTAKESGDIDDFVRSVISNVRARGDAALIDYSLEYDKSFKGRIAVDKKDIKAAYDEADPDFIAAMIHATENIRGYHEHQIQEGYEIRSDNGSIMGQMVRGLSRVGIYVPGGTAAYPSTVLMNAIPAKLAGVDELIMLTPPPAKPEILAAAFVAGVDKVFQVGGAQAIAAMAFGTESIPKVDKIVGPGNIYVTRAKRFLFGTVDIDMIAGPSEILVMADSDADPVYVAADMLSQAEHDGMSSSVLLTCSEELAEKTNEEISSQLETLSRREIAKKSLDDYGLILVCRSEDEMVGIANTFAPEHMELLVEDPLRLVPEIKNAGSIFCGPYSPEPLGDYFSGANHVLPTYGTASWASPLGVYDFIKRTSYTMYTKEGLAAAADDIRAIGKAEGLQAHVAAVDKRFE